MTLRRPHNTDRPCANRCGRRIDPRAAHGEEVCAACRCAMRNGYHLSPAPEAGERADPRREERLRLYEERAAAGADLFGGGGTQ